jgi:outer membrane lipoprotein-sorting protein
MKRILTLLPLLLCLALPGQAQQRASLEALSAYINTIDSAAARFQQTNADGSTSNGVLYIKRPGQARFEYDPPNQDTLVVAGAGAVAVFDGRGRPEQFPLARTPLNLILQRNIDLTKAKMITGIGTHRGMTIVEAQDPGNPQYGSIRLYFETNPMRLAEWLITAESGEKTRVVLGLFQNQPNLSRFLFDIDYIERQRK